MKKHIIQYSIVQFIPYPDREESVNMGLVCYCRKTKKFAFKLLSTRKQGRVNQFFKTLPKDLFKQSLTLVNKELNRLDFMQHKEVLPEAVFLELVRPRDSLVGYTDIRVLMADHFEQTLNQLFDDLVAFDSKTYKKNHDAVLAKKFKNILKQHHVDTLFKDVHLEKKDIGLSVPMPFFNEVSHKSVKPLSFLEQKDANSLIKHAANWAMQIELLEQAELLDVTKHLVTYEKPESHYESAFEFALEVLDKTNVQLAGIDSAAKINDFLRVH